MKRPPRPGDRAPAAGRGARPGGGACPTAGRACHVAARAGLPAAAGRSAATAIHSDAALSGGYASFLDPRPAYDFADGADSISISGHKFIGSPIPCGVVLARKRHVDRIARSIGYIGSLDTTVTGSRNGLTPLFLWYAIKALGVEGLRRRIERSLALAAYAERRLKEAGIEAWRNPNAITVVFPQTSPQVREKWQLATQGVAHLIVMPGVTEDQIDELLADMITSHPAEPAVDRAEARG